MAANESGVKHAGGRPPKYQADFARQAELLCKLGATDDELAAFFEVATYTIRRWQSEHEEFRAALKVGKEVADDRVERSLYQRAVGYTFNSEKVFQFQGQIVRAEITEHLPPETIACIFWLKNRRKSDWRDKHEVEHGGSVKHISAVPLTQEEWSARYSGGSGNG